MASIFSNTPTNTSHKWDTNTIWYTFDVNRLAPQFNTVEFNETQKAQTKDAFAQWAAVANLTFVETPFLQTNTNILIGLQSNSDSDGPLGIIGLVNQFNINGVDPNLMETTAPIFEGESYWLRMDPAETDPVAFATTLTHEIGHILGLDHITSAPSIMDPFYGGPNSRNTLQAVDITAVTALYGELTTPDVFGQFPAADTGASTNDTSAFGSINVGQTVGGEHPFGDIEDWYEISLTAGREYTFESKGLSTSSGTMTDPYLRILDSSGTVITFDDDGGTGTNARLVFTPTETGTYYVMSQYYNLKTASQKATVFDLDYFTGTYSLSVSAANTAPVAVNDTITLPADTRFGSTYTAPLSLNDSDADGDDLSYNILTQPSKTEATIFNVGDGLSEVLLLKAYSGATGIDSFTYQVDDGNGGTGTATVTINLDSSFNGNDIINGSANDDIFVAGLGSDSFSGDAGSDTIKFDGTRSEYTYQEVGNTVVISDSQISRDGIDTLNSIETYSFTDRDYTLAELINPTDIDRGIYRFFNVDTGTHFLSGSTVERDSVINNLDSFNFEGPTFKAADPSNPAADTVFRFFNTQTGTHFFTQSTVERDNILDTIPQFNFEGEAYKGYTEQVDGSIPLYRFFNTQTGTHFYTAAEVEKDSIIENLPTFNFEGTAYWVDAVMG